MFFDSPPLDIAERALQKIKVDYPDSDNWHTSFFSTIYLGSRTPIATTLLLSIRLKPPTPPAEFKDPQIYSTARYLRAIGIWIVHLRDEEACNPQKRVLKHQMDRYFHTFGNPGQKTDELCTSPVLDDIHVTVFCQGVPHTVRIATSSIVLSVEAISAQLAVIKAQEIVRKPAFLPSQMD